MLVLDFVLLAIVALSAIGASVLMIRKFPRLAALDVDALPTQQQEDIKFSLIEQRLERKMKAGWGKFAHFSHPAYGIIQHVVAATKGAIAETEKRMRREKKIQSKTLSLEEQENARKKISELLERGRAFLTEEQYAEAEKRFIEVLSYESQNLESYQALGELYVAQKQWENAKQIYAHLQKLSPNDAAIVYELGEIYSALDQPKKAVDQFVRAVEIEENNPKYLTSLLEISIRLRKKVMAVTTLRKLIEVNPENQALKEFENQIDRI